MWLMHMQQFVNVGNAVNRKKSDIETPKRVPFRVMSSSALLSLRLECGSLLKSLALTNRTVVLANLETSDLV
jgi:hypothetical protein